MSDDVRRRLEDAGSREVPPPDVAFADALEARLRAVGASLPPAAPEPPRRPRPALGLRLAGVAAVALVAAIAVLLLGPATRPPAPRLVAPVNVEVSLVGGTTLEDPDGLSLPDGTVIRVGEGGFARIGDVTLGPGDVATVRDGRLNVERPTAGVVPGSTPSATAPTAPGPRASHAATPAPSGPGRTTPGPSPAPTPSPTPSVETPPDRTAEPTVAPTPVPVRTPLPTASPTPTPTILRPRLRARVISGPRIAVRWTETWRAASYVLLATASRTGPAPDPVYPGSRVLGTYPQPPETRLRFRVPAGVTEVRLMVVALRKDGSVLRRSRIVALAIPAADTAGPSPSLEPAPSPSPVVAPTPTPAP